MKTKKIIAIFLLLTLLVISGCEGNTTNKQGSNISFTDALGRNIVLDNKPKRVAALLGSFADVWILAGGEICATADDAWQDFDLELCDAVNIGGAHSPSLELLLSANPDFVIASASTASNVALKETLENAKINVAYFDVDNFDDYLFMLDLCTDITGRKDLYQKNGLKIKEDIDKIKLECKNNNISEKERTVLLLRASSGSVKAKGSSGTILGEMLNDLGCINIADNDATLLENLSVESIIKQEPYRIFVVTMGDDTQKSIDNFYQIISENPAWNTLDAVKNKRIYIMDRKLFNIKPNVKWAVSYEKLGKILLS